MKTLIIAGIVAFITFATWYARRNRPAVYQEPEPLPDQADPDEPVDFGYKTNWLAVKTDKKQELANALGLKKINPCNWKNGIAKAYGTKGDVFITPPIGVWTLAIGNVVRGTSDEEAVDNLEILLNKLSAQFGEAQYFGSHRVVDYHAWIKSVNGKTERIYVDDQGKNIKVYGEPTAPEQGLMLYNSLSEEAKSGDYLNRPDLVHADEALVMTIARSWSVDPTTLSERPDIKPGPGLVGKAHFSRL